MAQGSLRRSREETVIPSTGTVARLWRPKLSGAKDLPSCESLRQYHLNLELRWELGGGVESRDQRLRSFKRGSEVVDNNGIAALLVITPYLLALMLYKIITRSDAGLYRKRKFFAWGAAIGMIWGLNSLLREYLKLWYSLDNVSGSTAISSFFLLSLAIIVLTLVCGSIGFAFGAIRDRIKGPLEPK